ncbi:MAG: urea ABC transporter permease subunit UrtB, partial [Verrucomicrobiota bacterium]
HGELMMIGAYATYEMQMVFVRMIDRGDLSQAAYDWYYVCAGPAAFLAAAFVGYLMEITVVRHLYRRPLESLLATWGVGLILIQIVRIRYGDNIGVNAPHWARGGVEVFQDVILPYSRCFIIGLAVLCVGLIYFIMNRTGVGLRMRATMQNREMANSMGVNTGRVDRFTFAFGSGIAGIAGYAWTLIGGVTPDMGQKNFIVDSFLVVVTGGVGELMGVICAGLGIGVISKLLEPMTIGGVTIGAIWAKVILLVVIVIFIQFKPAGLFAPKGRLADV